MHQTRINFVIYTIIKNKNTQVLFNHLLNKYLCETKNRFFFKWRILSHLVCEVMQDVNVSVITSSHACQIKQEICPQPRADVALIEEIGQTVWKQKMNYWNPILCRKSVNKREEAQVLHFTPNTYISHALHLKETFRKGKYLQKEYEVILRNFNLIQNGLEWLKSTEVW